jgi:hypothetical protein
MLLFVVKAWSLPIEWATCVGCGITRTYQSVGDVKSFITSTPVVSVKTSIFVTGLEEARVFVPGQEFRPSLILASKARAYPNVPLKG